jgi:Eukaryotic aspartyl protease
LTNIVYSINIGIGSKNEQFQVLLDLTNTDFWVFDLQSCDDHGCAGDPYLTTSDSLVRYPQDNWTSFFRPGIPYYPPGLAVASGYYAMDTVTLAGFTIPYAIFGLATAVDFSITNGVHIFVINIVV